MRIDKTHRHWIIAALVISVAAGLGYISYVIWSPEGARGGSAAGLTFGIAGYGLMLYAGFLGLRKRVRSWKIGRAQTWMRGHLWLGLATVPLILFHAGFAWRGPLTLTLMILFAIVIASGIFGAILQHYLPTVITVDVPMETIYEEIPHVRKQLLGEADTLIDSVCGSAEAVMVGAGGSTVQNERARFREVYNRNLRPFLERPDGEDLELGNATGAAQFFDSLRRTTPGSFHPAIQDLENIFKEQRQFRRQMRLYRLLHTWLLIHVPVSVVLLVLATIHAAVALRF
jgi:hypothetical protein